MGFGGGGGVGVGRRGERRVWGGERRVSVKPWRRDVGKEEGDTRGGSSLWRERERTSRLH